MDYKDYYKILGVAKTASTSDIKKAYRRLARKYHPDVSKDVTGEEKFKEVNEAYEVLKDDEKRKLYDQLGANWKAGQGAGFGQGGAQGFGGAGFSPGAGGSFADFFESMFTGGAAGMGGAQQQRRQQARKGDDQRVRYPVSLEDVYNGATRAVNITVPEVDAQGIVRNNARRLSVKIPQGVKAGQSIRLKEQGSAGKAGGPNGDLYLEIEYQLHPRFTVQGRDVTVKLPIAPWEAINGTKAAVATLGGSVELKIPENAKTGQRMRLKGRGLPGMPAGDQFVELQIQIPPANNVEEKAIYKEMEKIFKGFNPRQ